MNFSLWNGVVSFLITEMFRDPAFTQVLEWLMQSPVAYTLFLPEGIRLYAT